MKPMSILAGSYGLLLLGLSLFAAFLFQNHNDFFQESLSMALTEQGTSIEQYQLHWNSTLVVGSLSIILGVAIWRGSRTALRIWLGLVVAISAAQVLLLVLRPLPFGFEQVDIIDFGIQTAVLLVSVVLIVRLKRQEATGA